MANLLVDFRNRYVHSQGPDANNSESCIARELCLQPAFSGCSFQVVRKWSARHSQVLECHVRGPNGARTIVIKHQPMLTVSQSTVMREFTTLSRVRKLLKAETADGVPEPLLVLPDKGILVMSCVPGVPFTQVLKWNGNRAAGLLYGRKIYRNARQMGKWLRDFQSATRGSILAFNADSFMEHLERHALRLGEGGFGNELAQRILRTAADISVRLNGKVMPSAARHGDFIPQNILTNNAAVGVVDFEGLRDEDSIYNDAGMFLAYLFVLTARPTYLRYSLNQACGGFLEGYLTPDNADRDFVAIYTMKAAIRIVADGPSCTAVRNRRSISRMLVRLCETPPYEAEIKKWMYTRQTRKAISN